MHRHHRRGRSAAAGAAIVALLLLAACTNPAPGTDRADRGGGDPAVVPTDLGQVRGTVTGDVRVFQGIPYAAAPQGERRWRSPEPAAPWDGIRDATRPGDICPQPAEPRYGTQSEDCLNLKVTVPATATPEQPRPVLVALDAGGLTVSSYVGTDMAPTATDGDVVVVQLHERMGLFGFFAHPGLDDPAAGGFGVRDQQAALGWVQRNIAAFGGDPDKVTLAGTSGGGVATCANVLSPGSAGLIDRAIISSGACDLSLPGFAPGAPNLDAVGPLADVQATGVALAADLGCADAADPVACLRDKPFEDFADHVPGLGKIAYGNAVLPLPPAQALRTGQFNQVPVLTGTTTDEMTLYANLVAPQGMDEATAAALLDDGSANLPAALAEFPPSAYGGSPGAAWAAATTGRHFVLRAWQDYRAMARHVPVFAYEFADREAPFDPSGLGLPAQPTDQVALPYGASHGSDVPYVHRGLASAPPPFDQEQTVLAEEMLRYWTTFAHRGDPNAEGVAPWPAFDPAAVTPHVQRLTTTSQAGIGPVDLAAEHHLDFWGELYPPRS